VVVVVVVVVEEEKVGGRSWRVGGDQASMGIVVADGYSRADAPPDFRPGLL
jgi:hypothetical protein